MKLSVMERLILGNILPAEGDFSTLKILRNLRMSLSFSEEEAKRWNIRAADGKMTWNIANNKGQPLDQDSDIKVGERAEEIIVASLKKLNDDKKLTNEHYSLYEKFIEGNGSVPIESKVKQSS